MLGLVFIFAGSTKAVSTVGQNTLLEEFVRRTSAHSLYALAALEIALGAALVAGLRVRAASLGVTILLSLFTGLIVGEILKDAPKTCGCLGGDGSPDAAVARWRLVGSLVRNGVLTAIAVFLFLTARTRHVVKAVPPWAIGRGLPW